MQQSIQLELRRPAIRRTAVVSLDLRGFEAACAELLRLAAARDRPDVVIGIPTGGRWVAEAMARAAPLPTLSLTCRRPSTATKQRSGLVRAVLGRLPRPALDRLRVLEHRFLARQHASAGAQQRHFDAEEQAQLRDWFAAGARTPSVLVVDDAVDSGATLAAVLTEVRRLAPPGARIASAAITVTTERPIARPDFALFDRQLCRFPWSMDA